MYEFLDYQAQDVMSTELVTLEPQSSLAEAEALFEKHGFNALPVVEGDRRLVGMVTSLDLLRAYAFTEEHLFPPYDEIMSRPVVRSMTLEVKTVTPRTPLTRVLQKLLDTRNKSFPVVEDDRLVGMISREDVIRGLRRAQEAGRSGGAKDGKRR